MIIKGAEREPWKRERKIIPASEDNVDLAVRSSYRVTWRVSQGLEGDMWTNIPTYSALRQLFRYLDVCIKDRAQSRYVLWAKNHRTRVNGGNLSHSDFPSYADTLHVRDPNTCDPSDWGYEW